MKTQMNENDRVFEKKHEILTKVFDSLFENRSIFNVIADSATANKQLVDDHEKNFMKMNNNDEDEYDRMYVDYDIMKNSNL